VNDRKADFLILGAQKAGTTSLYRYLLQHPGICFSDVKEVNYFVIDRLYGKGESYYHSYFRNCRSGQLAGSAYVHMLPCGKAVDRVWAYNPNMKLLVMLREPVSRSWSAYQYALRNGWESPGTPFAATVGLEPGRLSDERYDVTYFHNGLYHRHLVRWLERFPRNQLHIMRLDDLRSDPGRLMDGVFRFLGLDPIPVDTRERHNEGSSVFSPGLQKVMLAKRRSNPWGRLLPQRAKVFIRARVFPLIYRLNTRSGKGAAAMSEADRRLAEPLFTEDLSALQRDFGIAF